MQARMKNPALVIPEALPAIQALYAATAKGGVPPAVGHLVHLRTSQINGCGFCVDGGVKHAKKAGETDDRLFAVAAWRDTPYFNDAERAALALSEAVTRMSDRSDPVPDEVWDEAAKHYDEKGLAALLLVISLTNVFNRLNVSTRQPAGAGW
ncbi:MAG: carboxymuconolactone decarboxylase family protein [Rhizomicrobium sp.]